VWEDVPERAGDGRGASGGCSSREADVTKRVGVAVGGEAGAHLLSKHRREAELLILARSPTNTSTSRSIARRSSTPSARHRDDALRLDTSDSSCRLGDCGVVGGVEHEGTALVTERLPGQRTAGSILSAVAGTTTLAAGRLSCSMYKSPTQGRGGARRRRRRPQRGGRAEAAGGTGGWTEIADKQRIPLHSTRRRYLGL